MNRTLSAAERAAVLQILEQGLLAIRDTQDIERAQAIATALHLCPSLLLPPDRPYPPFWTLERLHQRFLRPLAARYPELGRLQAPLKAWSADARQAVADAQALGAGTPAARAAAARRAAIWVRAPHELHTQRAFVDLMVASDFDAADALIVAHAAEPSMFVQRHRSPRGADNR